MRKKYSKVHWLKCHAIWVSFHLIHLLLIKMIRALLPFPCIFNAAQFLFLICLSYSIIVKLFWILKSLILRILVKMNYGPVTPPSQIAISRICKLFYSLSWSSWYVFGITVGSLEISLWYGDARICLYLDASWHSCSLLRSHLLTLATRYCQINIC
jgi:hypothetical protein